MGQRWKPIEQQHIVLLPMEMQSLFRFVSLRLVSFRLVSLRLVSPRFASLRFASSRLVSSRVRYSCILLKHQIQIVSFFPLPVQHSLFK